MCAAEGVEGEHLGAMRAFAELVERCRRLGVRERRREVELRQGGVGCIEARAQDPALVAPAQVEGPGRVGLVLQNLAADEIERVLERFARTAGRFACGALEQLVEAVEVERDELRGEAVRLGLCHHELARALAVGGEMASKYRDERLQGAGRVLGAGVSPDELGKAVGWHEMAARCEQDLEHLLRSRAAEIAWAEAALALLDRERSEEPESPAAPPAHDRRSADQRPVRSHDQPEAAEFADVLT